VELTPGTILLSKYRIDELIGTGGMGNVVRASHLYLHQPVAIKLLLPEMAESASTVQRFLREAQSTVKLRSEHIARVMDVGTTPDGIPFMVMEFLDGNDLNQILRHHGPQQPAIVIDLMLQACEGIAEAHALGIIHRDIKPSNFFITRRPDGSMLLKILDFGISKTPIGYGELTGTQTVMGTPSYMAPEQMKSGRDADPRSDLWSIGVVMYQLITGRPPFAGESYAELVLKVGLEPPEPLLMPLPAGLADVMMRCLEKDPGARYQTVGELARVIAPYATDPVSASQSAGRAMRILQLQQRGSLPGMQGSPLTAGGGLATPIPISPAQLTPRSWPPSQGTSAHGAGQLTLRTRANRGWLISSVAGLCVLAGGGGYAISQMSKPNHHPDEPHVMAPLTRAASEPTAPAPTPSAAAPTAAASPVTPSTAAALATPPAPAAVTPTAAAPTAPVAVEPRPAVATPPVAAAADPSSAWRATTPAPTFPDHAAQPTDSKGSGKPAVARTAGSQLVEPRSASSTLIDAKHPGERARPTETKAIAKPAKPTQAKPADARSTSKPAETKPSKSTKTKPSDDLFDDRH
jgi:serine/threonine protein kinase